MRYSRALLFLVLMGILAGCSSHYRVAPVISTEKRSRVVWRKVDKGALLVDPFSHTELINPYTYNPAIGNIGESLYELARKSDDKDAAKMARNDLQNAIIRVSKGNTAKHLARLKSTDNAVNLVLGSAQLGLSGGASVAAEHSARALAAASTGAGGARELFTEQVYRNALVESLTRLILTEQDRFYEEVIRPRQASPITEYGVEAAITDAISYHEKGSFYFGLSLAREAIERQTSANMNSVSNAVQGRATSTEALFEFNLLTAMKDAATLEKAKAYLAQKYPSDPNKGDPVKFIKASRSDRVAVLKDLAAHLTAQ
jgi:hypothetical protein